MISQLFPKVCLQISLSRARPERNLHVLAHRARATLFLSYCGNRSLNSAVGLTPHAKLDAAEKYLAGIKLIKTNGSLVVSSESRSVAVNAEQVIQEINSLRKQRMKEKREDMNRRSASAAIANSTQSASDNYLEGLKLIEEAAMERNPDALCYLGNLEMQVASGESAHKQEEHSRSNGNGYFEEDAAQLKGLKYYEQAAEFGQTDALYNLGNIYHEGIRKSCKASRGENGEFNTPESGSGINELNEEWLVAPDPIRSNFYFERAAELGDCSALFWLGYCSYEKYITLSDNVVAISMTVDPLSTVDINELRTAEVTALNYLLQAAAAGHDKADYYIAIMMRRAFEIETSRAFGSQQQQDVATDRHSTHVPFYYFLARSVLLQASYDANEHSSGGKVQSAADGADHSALNYFVAMCMERYFYGNYLPSKANGALEDSIVSAVIERWLEWLEPAVKATVTTDGSATTANCSAGGCANPNCCQNMQPPQLLSKTDAKVGTASPVENAESTGDDEILSVMLPTSAAAAGQLVFRSGQNERGPMTLPAASNFGSMTNAMLRLLLDGKLLEHDDTPSSREIASVDRVHNIRMGLLALLQASVALHNNVESALILGAMNFHGYRNGNQQYCPRDLMKAFSYYNIAAEQGDERAWRNVADMYDRGLGVPQNRDAAREIRKVVFSEIDDRDGASV